MEWWTVFETRILPWLIAAAVVALVISESHRTTAQMVGMNEQLGKAVAAQAEALEGIRQLLGTQGYTVGPFQAGPSKSGG